MHNVHICLRRALESARADGLIKTNPADGAHRNPRDRPEMMTWTREELAAFLDHVVNDRDHALFRAAAATGTRRGELLGLRWRDLDLRAAQLHVRQQWSRQRGKLTFGPPKTRNGIRTLDLDVGTVDRLTSIGLPKSSSVGAGGRATGQTWTSCSADATAEPTTRTWSTTGSTASSRELASARSASTTYATLQRQEGADIEFISRQLGRDSVQTTLDLYGHITPKVRAAAASKIAEILDSPAPSALKPERGDVKARDGD